MQILHPFRGSIQQYSEQLHDPDRYRPRTCPLCQAKDPLAGHGFYQRTVVDDSLEGIIRVRRYLRWLLSYCVAVARVSASLCAL
jgi:hypothetical protein